VNLPNFLTVLRVLSVPVFIYLLLSPSFEARVTAFVLFALASITDLIDGYLARKWNQVTEFGKFLDPLADKALVLGAFITFIFLSDQIQVWMVLCIVGRDMLITSLRYLAIHRGRSLRTSVFGKIKTAFQMFAIATILLSFLIVSYKERNTINELYSTARAQGIDPWYVAYDNLNEFLHTDAHPVLYSLASFLPYYLMLITMVFTVISGLRYLITNYELFLGPWPVFDRFRKRKDTKG